MRYFTVTAKCGHVGRDCYIPITFAVKANSAKEAASVTRFLPRVKHHHKDAILSVKEVDFSAYQDRCYDADALSPEDFRKWILPPVEQDDEQEEVIFGDGFEVSLDDPSDADDADPAVFNRAIEYCRSGKIGYVSIRNGEGRAFVQGSHWYEVDFRLHDHMLQEAYCECPYPGLCKHLLSVGVLLATMLRHGDIDLGRDFTLIASDRFWNMVRHSGQEVSV